MFKPTSYLLMAYVLCLNCGRISAEGMFCTFCHSPLFGANPRQELMMEFTSEKLKEKTLHSHYL